MTVAPFHLTNWETSSTNRDGDALTSAGHVGRLHAAPLGGAVRQSQGPAARRAVEGSNAKRRGSEVLGWCAEVFFPRCVLCGFAFLFGFFPQLVNASVFFSAETADLGEPMVRNSDAGGDGTWRVPAQGTPNSNLLNLAGTLAHTCSEPLRNSFSCWGVPPK